MELDPSRECSLLTISQWIILSTSDYVVTQTDKTGSPISAYSRYAAVYGLKGDSLRDGELRGGPVHVRHIQKVERKLVLRLRPRSNKKNEQFVAD